MPLSHQAIAILKHIHAINGEHEQVFMGDHNPYKPMSENTINTALRIMGYMIQRMKSVGMVLGLWLVVL